MPIEGPLRELGIHDVFQLLDLSRKTGVLRVTSELRDDEGFVYFENGRVVHASIRSKPSAIEDVLLRVGRITEVDLQNARRLQPQLGTGTTVADVLVEAGAVTTRELERQLKQQLESVVFDLLSWREGYFSFEEQPIDDIASEARIKVATESLLMEGARRIDEWSRIANKVPNLSVVPALAAVQPDHETRLDLLPHEWEVLTMIDGKRDLHAIAAALGRAEFEVAKVAYGLVTTGIIEVRRQDPATAPDSARGVPRAEPVVHPAVNSARKLGRSGRMEEALAELREAAEANPAEPQLHMELGFTAARAGDLDTARSSWEHFLKLVPEDRSAGRVRHALGALTRLLAVMETHGSD